MIITFEPGEIKTFPVPGYFFYYNRGDGEIRVTLYDDENGAEPPAVLLPGQGLDGSRRFERWEVENISGATQTVTLEIRNRKFVDNRTDNKLTVTTEIGEPLPVTVAGGGASIGTFVVQATTADHEKAAGVSTTEQVGFEMQIPANMKLHALRFKEWRTVLNQYGSVSYPSLYMGQIYGSQTTVSSYPAQVSPVQQQYYQGEGYPQVKINKRSAAQAGTDLADFLTNLNSSSHNAIRLAPFTTEASGLFVRDVELIIPGSYMDSATTVFVASPYYGEGGIALEADYEFVA